MKKRIIILTTICVSLSSLAFGTGTFTTSIIQKTSSPETSQCIVLQAANVNAEPEEPYMVSWHSSWRWEPDPYGNFRCELMQSFLVPPEATDCNFGAFAGQLRYDYPGSANPVAGADNRVLIISLYKLKDIADGVPDDRDILSQWISPIPPGTDSAPLLDPGKTDPARGHAADWIKFTLNPGYRLERNQQYGVRLAWQSPQPSTDTSLGYIYFWVCSSSYQWEEYFDNLRMYGLYLYGDVSRYYDIHRNSYYPYFINKNRDMNFAIIKANPASDIISAKKTGDADLDGKVQFNDFASQAANWQVDTKRSLLDTNIPYLIDGDAPVDNVLVINNQPKASPDSNLTPHAEWTLNNTPYVFELAQSFRATSNATMGGIAVQLSTGEWPVNEDTAGYFNIKVYSVANNNTAPQNGTLLKTFQGWFPYYTVGGDDPYTDQNLILHRLVNQRDWITFILPSGVDLIAGNYYAFTLEWKDATDPTGRSDFLNRKFFIDSSLQNGTDVYIDGSCFYKSLATSGLYIPYNLDLDFAIIGKTNICSDNPPGFQRLVGDINIDCKVDFKDIDILCENWLTSNLD